MMEFLWRRLRRGERGFTLIELLIVVAIIAILAAILIPNFLQSRASAQVAASKSNMRNYATALEAYQADKLQYPSASNNQPEGLATTYIGSIPPDPCSSAGYKYTPVGTPPTNFRLDSNNGAGDWASACKNTGIKGIYYTPAGGLQETK